MDVKIKTKAPRPFTVSALCVFAGYRKENDFFFQIEFSECFLTLIGTNQLYSTVSLFHMFFISMGT